MQVKIVNQSQHPLPEYATPQSAGLDLRANLGAPITLAPLERVLVPTGLYIALPEGFLNLTNDSEQTLCLLLPFYVYLHVF